MRYIPCTKCPDCGLYNDFTVELCDCGTELSPKDANGYVIVDLLDAVRFPYEQRGEINEELSVYAQTCKKCGAVTYIADPSRLAKKCWSHGGFCGNSNTPVSFVYPPEAEGKNNSGSRIQLPGTDGAPEQEPPAEPEADQSFSQMHQTLAKKVTPPEADPDGEDDDDDDVGDWGFVTGATPKAKPAPAGTPAAAAPVAAAAPQKGKAISLTDPCSGSVLLYLTAEEAAPGVELGRERKLSGFFAHDFRVGRNHCTIRCMGGKWQVSDHSRNGTFVNNRDIGQDGTAELTDGAKITFGHERDSLYLEVKFT